MKKILFGLFLSISFVSFLYAQNDEPIYSEELLSQLEDLIEEGGGKNSPMGQMFWGTLQAERAYQRLIKFEKPLKLSRAKFLPKEAGYLWDSKKDQCIFYEYYLFYSLTKCNGIDKAVENYGKKTERVIFGVPSSSGFVKPPSQDELKKIKNNFKSYFLEGFKVQGKLSKDDEFVLNDKMNSGLYKDMSFSGWIIEPTFSFEKNLFYFVADVNAPGTGLPSNYQIKLLALDRLGFIPITIVLSESFTLSLNESNRKNDLSEELIFDIFNSYKLENKYSYNSYSFEEKENKISFDKIVDDAFTEIK